MCSDVTCSVVPDVECEIFFDASWSLDSLLPRVIRHGCRCGAVSLLRVVEEYQKCVTRTHQFIHRHVNCAPPNAIVVLSVLWRTAAVGIRRLRAVVIVFLFRLVDVMIQIAV